MSRSRKPNIFLIMADQWSPSVLGAGGNPAAKTPNIDALAEPGVIFDNFYCNSPLCGPSRGSMMTGRYASEVGCYDNGAELPASIPTFVHHLRRADYRTILAGKMHFAGPDQLHGFEERLTTDIYPASFLWTPDWDESPVHNPGTSVRQLRDSGVVKWNMQLDYDEEVHHQTLQALRDVARDESGRPFFLCASYTHPHDPFTTLRRYWDLYEGVEIPLPDIADDSLEGLHPYNQWLQIHHEVDLYPPTEEQVYRTRRAYYAMVSYFDEKVGELVRALHDLDLSDHTIVIVTSDHGEMLGEHGMWFKRVFYEDSVRVPMIVRGPAEWGRGRRIAEVASLIDLYPTLVDLGRVPEPEAAKSLSSGDSLLRLLEGGGESWKGEAIAEYCGEGVCNAARMLRTGRYKYVCVEQHEPQLFDLAADPGETDNVSGKSELRQVEEHLQARVLEGWDGPTVEAQVRESQRQRRVILEALSKGEQTSWDYQPMVNAADQFVRRGHVTAKAKELRLPNSEE